MWQTWGEDTDARTDRLITAYLAESPVTAEALRGVDVYAAFMLARSATYFAWRLAHGITRGDPDPQANAQSLAEHWDELAQMLDGQRHVLPPQYRV